MDELNKLVPTVKLILGIIGILGVVWVGHNALHMIDKAINKPRR